MSCNVKYMWFAYILLYLFLRFKLFYETFLVPANGDCLASFFPIYTPLFCFPISLAKCPVQSKR